MNAEPDKYALKRAIARTIAAVKEAGYRPTAQYVLAGGVIRVEVEPLRWVYFIQTSRSWNVKVGIAAKPLSRLATLRTGNAEELEIIATFRGTTADEAAIHRALQHYRLRGEWFEFGPWIEIVRRAHAEREGPKSLLRRLRSHRP